MNTNTSVIYRRAPRNLEARLDLALARAADARSMKQPATVWFRADDIGVPSRQCRRMLNVFAAHQVPLALALVPAWLTEPRWKALIADGGDGVPLWGWHQHGWRHHNHEPAGKKQEFGPARRPGTLRADLERGRRRLVSILEEAFLPAFTPPWNRCSAETLEQLKALGFRAVSRSQGAKPPAPRALCDLNVNVDLHTRKAVRPHEDWEALLRELESALVGGWCGIMLHHQRMNAFAFDFLEILLQHMVKHKHFRIVHLKTLLK
ncbi:MAG: polysaccharide deacetylase family protein [Desulfosarcinaceae bacterium]